MSGEGKVAARALELIAAGQVRLRLTDGGRAAAEVTGRTGRYLVRRTPNGKWSCGCLASSYHAPDCSHRIAAKLIHAAVA
jgi:hypothetical protein